MSHHLTADGLFHSDKYPTTPVGFVPLKVTDKDAQDLLYTYAERRLKIDADPEFANDLIEALANQGYGPAVNKRRQAALEG